MTVARLGRKQERYEGLRIEEPRIVGIEQERLRGGSREHGVPRHVGPNPARRYLACRDQLRHGFEPEIYDGRFAVMPLEHQSETVSSRLPVASLKWQLVNLGSGEHQLLAGNRDRIDPRDEIGCRLINEVPDAAGLLGSGRDCGCLYCGRAVHRRLQGQRLRFSYLFSDAAMEAKSRRSADPAVAPYEDQGLEHCKISYATGKKNPPD